MIVYDNDGNMVKVTDIVTCQCVPNFELRPLDKFYSKSFNKNRVFNDSFGILQKYTSINFADVSNTLPQDLFVKPVFESFEELVDRRIIELCDKYEHITILWSGGCDSCTMVASIIRNNIPKDKYEILFNVGATEESPKFAEFIKKQGLTVRYLGDAPIYDYLNSYTGNTQFINGCPEQIFRYPIMSQKGVDHFWKHYKDGVVDNLVTHGVSLTENEKEELVSIFEEYIAKLDLPIIHTIDLFWLVIFSGAWTFIPHMFESCLDVNSPYRANHTDFFLTENFARWAVQNSLFHNPYDNWFKYGSLKYRTDEKNYIRTVFDDPELDNKLKFGSQTRDHERYNNDSVFISLYHTDGLVMLPKEYLGYAKRLVLRSEYEPLYNESLQQKV